MAASAIQTTHKRRPMPAAPLSFPPCPPPNVPMESQSTLCCVHAENSDIINTDINADATNDGISSNAALRPGTRENTSCAYWLPAEIWLHHVFPYFYPSQLIAFSLVSQHMRMLVLSAPAWQLIYQKSMLSFREPLPRCLSHAAADAPGGSGLREARWAIKAYEMKAVCAFSFRICEQCFRLCTEGRCAPASMPLPVRESYLSQPMGKQSLMTEACLPTVDATIHASSLCAPTCPIMPASITPAVVPAVTNVSEVSIAGPCVRLCLQCRQDLYEKHPEQLYPAVEGSDEIRITRHRAMSKYALNGPEILISNALSTLAEENPSDVPDLANPLPRFLSSREVLRAARRVHGGQVGVDAIVSWGISTAKIVSSLQREALFRSEWAALSSAS